MKKKLFLFSMMVAILTCVLALGVSAAVTTYDDAPTRTILEMNEDEYVVFSDGFSCPSYYIIPDQTQLKDTDYTYINGKTGKTYTNDDVVEMHVPTGITDIYKRFGDWKIFTNCTVVGVPSTATVAGQFGSQSTVTKVYLSDEHTSIPEWAFSGSTTLEEVIISENSKIEVIYGGAFQNCNSLKYLYLPEGFKRFDNSNGYEPFNNFAPTHGNFGFINSPDETEIPEVYFFPSTFEYTESFLWGSRIRNNAIVLPETVTAITGKYDLDNTYVTCVVLLSDSVTEVNLWNTTNGSKIYLPNMSSDSMNGDFFQANASAVESTVTGGILSHTSRRGGQQYYYFGVDQKYTKSVWSNSMQLTGLAPFQAISSSDHLNAYHESFDATCTEDAWSKVTCVCGVVKTQTITENSALDHEFDVENGAINLGLVYESFLEKGTLKIQCARCTETSDTEYEALFISQGYSVEEGDGGGIVIGFNVNHDAILVYEQKTGVTLSYGLFAVGYEKLAGNDILNAETAEPYNDVIKAEITNKKFVSIKLKIVGFDTTDSKKTKLTLGMYAVETQGEAKKIHYLQEGTPKENEKYAYVTYNDFVTTAQ